MLDSDYPYQELGVELHKDTLTALGALVCLDGQLDFQLTAIIWRLGRQSDPEKEPHITVTNFSVAVTTYMGFPAKRDAIVALTKEEWGYDEQLFSRVREAMKHVQKAKLERNHLIHGLWATIQDTSNPDHERHVVPIRYMLKSSKGVDVNLGPEIDEKPGSLEHVKRLVGDYQRIIHECKQIRLELAQKQIEYDAPPRKP